MPDQVVQGSSSGNEGQGPDGSPRLGPVLREQANKLADRSKAAGAETAAAVGKAVESAANELQQDIPELANYVRNAATFTQRLSDDLKHRTASDLLSDAVGWGRQQPLLALAGAAVLGFALARILKGGLTEGGEPRQGESHGEGAST